MKILVSAGPIEVYLSADGHVVVVQRDDGDDAIVSMSPSDARLVIAAVQKLLDEPEDDGAT